MNTSKHRLNKDVFLFLESSAVRMSAEGDKRHLLGLTDSVDILAFHGVISIPERTRIMKILEEA